MLLMEMVLILIWNKNKYNLKWLWFLILYAINQNKIKKIGTRQEVYRGLAIRTAGGLSKNDIIEKQFGTRTLYISTKLSDKMRDNFNLHRNNPRRQKRTMVASNINTPLTIQNNIQPIETRINQNMIFIKSALEHYGVL